MFPNQKFPFDAVIDKFSDEMKARMRDAAIKGRVGWDDPSQLGDFCAGLYNNTLQTMGGQPQEADVANFAMMIWNLRRGGGR